MYRSFIKPGFDFCFAFLILCITLPLLFILGFLLFLQNSGTPLFSQVRPGLKEKPFTIYKLKTMQDTRDDQGVLLPDNQRITPLGKIIRKLSLDELPQFWNVLKGDMSFVGPRPLLPEYLPLYNKKQKNRHNLKPGITGLAQVKGRNTISWQKKFEYDLWYIENQSFILDLKILLFTVGKIFKTQEVNASGLNTMGRFNGNN
ncbi:sugar transferase [Candidatus Arcticimaribacter]|nr:sugar transferase [Candidatus Arcticimaribacter sp.]MDA9638563.1 sugar transferase [Candidatus Arcticimaribacter sp.]